MKVEIKGNLYTCTSKGQEVCYRLVCKLSGWSDDVLVTDPGNTDCPWSDSFWFLLLSCVQRCLSGLSVCAADTQGALM